MANPFPSNAYHLPAYRKALEIFRISRAVASYFGDDKHVVEMELSASHSHRYAGNLVSESLQLAPGIASILSTGNSEVKLRKIRRIRKAAKSLRLYCKKLEFCGVKEVEFVNLLRKEIRQFEYLTSEWVKQIQKLP
ncbi:hypothetical protein [Salegentibacter chungangensis]|uniref:Four helix bundle protein n=1 Tax=Salegentibacter chungangensis TaxID=1335724 RepID=A0ABW3NN58_9FLAO